MRDIALGFFNIMRQIILYTSYYPYSVMSESFLTSELEIGIRKGKNIVVIPINKDKVERKVPEGVDIDKSICDSSVLKKIWAIITMARFFPLFFKYREFRGLNLKFALDAVKYIYAANLVYNDLVKKAKENQDCLFYSYWLSYIPIAFAYYKYKHPETSHRFIARGHGSDIYGRKIGVNYPFRNLVFKELDKILVISEYGKKFLCDSLGYSSDKIMVSRLGVYSNYHICNCTNKIVRVISCSSIIPLKRVNLVFNSLYNFAKNNEQYNIEWIHIGDGPLLNNLKNDIKKNSLGNLNCKLVGSMINKDILDLYKNMDVSVFILLSLSEGIPVSIMEAISSGIPAIATNVGGVSEIVNDSTGRLLDVNFDKKDFDKALSYIIDNNQVLSKSAYSFFLSRFDAEKNYNSLYDQFFFEYS